MHQRYLLKTFRALRTVLSDNIFEYSHLAKMNLCRATSRSQEYPESSTSVANNLGLTQIA